MRRAHSSLNAGAHTQQSLRGRRTNPASAALVHFVPATPVLKNSAQPSHVPIVLPAPQSLTEMGRPGSFSERLIITNVHSLCTTFFALEMNMTPARGNPCRIKHHAASQLASILPARRICALKSTPAQYEFGISAEPRTALVGCSNGLPTAALFFADELPTRYPVPRTVSISFPRGSPASSFRRR